MKLFSTLAAGALALAVALPAARSTADASAGASTLTITSLQCYDVGGSGIYYNETECYATTSGGAGGNTYDWGVIVNDQSDGANSSYIQGVCTNRYPVTLTVHDQSGATATRSKTFVCYANSTGGGLEP
jgi:hypothetical protein